MLLSYALSRSNFKRRFEPSGDGSIYRARATAPAISITQSEREELLGDFRRQYWRHQLAMLGITFALVLALVVLDQLLVPVEATESFVTIGAAIFAIPLIVAAYFANRRLFELPTRRFADRVPVAPARGWQEVIDTGLRERSWANLALGTIMVAGIGWLMFPDASANWWARPLWYAYFAGLSVFWLWTVWRKCQLDRWSGD